MTDLDALRLKWLKLSPDIKQIMMERLCQQAHENAGKTGNDSSKKTSFINNGQTP